MSEYSSNKAVGVAATRRFQAALISSGALVGACAGLLTGLNDFGAAWLWIPRWEDRGVFLLRLLGTQAPCGAAAGIVLAGIAAVALPRLMSVAVGSDGAGSKNADRKLDRLLSLLFATLLAPATARVALRLFTGGKMSRLDHRAWYEGATVVGLLLGSWLVLYAVLRLFRRGRRATFGRAALLTGTLLLAASLLAKVDQLLLPGIYEYLHAVLSLFCWSLLVFALSIPVARTGWVECGEGRLAAVGPVLLLVLGTSFLYTVSVLNENQNVRVALLGPRAANSRSLMVGLQPLLARVEKADQQKIRAARAARRARRADRFGVAPSLGPSLPDAHVLLISIDALRADHLGLYGYRRPTSPYLDRLAEESVVFERAYVPVPHSSYSISSMVTSEHLFNTVGLGRQLPEQTLATALNEAGYHTAAFFIRGIFYTETERFKAYANNAFGFAYHDHANARAERMTDKVLAEIDRTVERGEPSSLFWAHYFDVHEPYRETHFGTSDVDRYDSEILKVDRAVERLVAGARNRLEGDLIIAVTSDHGEEFREHGNVYHGSALYDEQVRVPLILHLPGLPARRVPAPVGTIDLAPTLLGLLEVPTPPGMRGSDLRALASGAQEERGPVFSSVLHKHMVVRWPYKMITDLRLGLFELFDLSGDPRERHNLADSKGRLVSSMRGELYAWLDDISTEVSYRENERMAAINRGRLGDRRAVEPLCEIVNDRSAPPEMRAEAARLAGALGDSKASPALRRALREPDDSLAAEAAIALGKLYDRRARRSLHKLVASQDPSLRVRAALALGRLRDPAAVPGLIEALQIAATECDRDDAVRLLGRLGDTRAVEPLMDQLPISRGRYLVLVALGQLKDPRVFEPLTDALSRESHTITLDAAVRGLGLLGDSRAVDLVVPLVTEQPRLTSCGETLVRLDAVGQRAIGGTDVALNGRGLGEFKSCHAGAEGSDWNFLHRTWCETRRNRARLQLTVPPVLREGSRGALVLLSVRRTDSVGSTELRLAIGDTELEPVQVDARWTEFRWPVDTTRLSKPSVPARLTAGERNARLALDHLLLVPLASEPEQLQGG